jgi:hypothetical protein
MPLTRVAKIDNFYYIVDDRTNDIVIPLDVSDLTTECKQRARVPTLRACFMDVNDVIIRLKDEILTDIQNPPEAITIDNIDSFIKSLTRCRNALDDLEI